MAKENTGYVYNVQFMDQNGKLSDKKVSSITHNITGIEKAVTMSKGNNAFAVVTVAQGKHSITVPMALKSNEDRTLLNPCVYPIFIGTARRIRYTSNGLEVDKTINVKTVLSDMPKFNTIISALITQNKQAQANKTKAGQNQRTLK